jgi:hypothetical protein
VLRASQLSHFGFFRRRPREKENGKAAILAALQKLPGDHHQTLIGFLYMTEASRPDEAG